MPEIKIDKIIRSGRRTLTLVVAQDAQLIARAPFAISERQINDFVHKKRDWIRKRQEIARIRIEETNVKKFINNETFLYLGKYHRFKIVESNSIALADYLEFPRSLLADARDHLTAWYKAHALRKISERADLYAKSWGLAYKTVRISNAKGRFGSCGQKGTLNFSWRLIMAPLRVIDYVVVHELAHLEVKNHSRRFWKKVKTIMPDYKEQRKWLRANGHLLVI